MHACECHTAARPSAARNLEAPADRGTAAKCQTTCFVYPCECVCAAVSVGGLRGRARNATRYQRVHNTELKIIHSVVCVGRRMHLILTYIGRTTTTTHALQERVVPAGRGARAR